MTFARGLRELLGPEEVLCRFSDHSQGLVERLSCTVPQRNNKKYRRLNLGA